MAHSYSIVKKGVAGNMRLNIVDITLDGSYAAGGYAITAASCGVGTIHHISPVMSTSGDTTKGLLPVYDPATGKLRIYKTGGTTTVTSGNGNLTELATNDTLISSSAKVRCVVIGDNVSG